MPCLFSRDRTFVIPVKNYAGAVIKVFLILPTFARSFYFVLKYFVQDRSKDYLTTAKV